MTLGVSPTDVQTMRGCLLEVGFGFLKENLDDDLRASVRAVKQLFERIAAAQEQNADHLELASDELGLAIRCIQYTMEDLDPGEFCTRVGALFEEAARTLAKLEAASHAARAEG